MLLILYSCLDIILWNIKCEITCRLNYLDMEIYKCQTSTGVTGQSEVVITYYYVSRMRKVQAVCGILVADASCVMHIIKTSLVRSHRSSDRIELIWILFASALIRVHVHDGIHVDCIHLGFIALFHLRRHCQELGARLFPCFDLDPHTSWVVNTGHLLLRREF